MTMTKSPSEFQKAKAIMSAELEDADPHAQHGEVDGPPASAAEPKVTKVPDGVTQARHYLMKAAALYNLTVKCVDKVVAPNVPPIAQTGEMFRAAVGTLFIEAARAGFVRMMPDKPLKHDRPEPTN